jgi:hypothetical protein
MERQNVFVLFFPLLVRNKPPPSLFLTTSEICSAVIVGFFFCGVIKGVGKHEILFPKHHGVFLSLSLLSHDYLRGVLGSKPNGRWQLFACFELGFRRALDDLSPNHVIFVVNISWGKIPY